jgi:murein DD-endopeptidase MepM/ murein hydrolase activator NlpD
LHTCCPAYRGLSWWCGLIVGLSTLANPGWSTPAVNVKAVLSGLPLPPDIKPPTEASLNPGPRLKRLVLGKPVADGDLRSGFGMRRHPIFRSSRMHTGVDWSARFGAPILSAAYGTVIKAEWAAGYGRRVEIQHADNVVSAYSHMSRFSVGIEPGTQVRQGQVIGFVGSTGLATGPHLHYEVLVNGHFVDPMDLYGPTGVSVAAKAEKITSPADGQATIDPARRVATLRTRQSPAAKSSAALAASLEQF